MQPMSFGFGVYFGKGNQWQSWIHIKDISRLFLHINEKDLSGIYNGVAPTPLSNFDFTKMVSKIRRGVLFLIPVPRLFFRLILKQLIFFTAFFFRSFFNSVQVLSDSSKKIKIVNYRKY